MKNSRINAAVVFAIAFLLCYLTITKPVTATDFLSSANGAQGYLNHDIDSDDNTFALHTNQGLAFPEPPTDNDFRVVIGSEIMNVTARASDVFTVDRGAEGTTPAAHYEDDLVSLNVTAGYVQQLQTAVESLEGLVTDGKVDVPHGGTGAATLTGLLLGQGTDPVVAITNNSTNWDTAYTDRMKWDGGSTGLDASAGRTSLSLSENDTVTHKNLVLARSVNDADAPRISFQKSRLGARIEGQDTLGWLRFYGYDGTGWSEGGYIECRATQAVGTNAMPGSLFFYTSPISSNIPLQRLQIDHTGRFIFGTTAAAPSFRFYTSTTYTDLDYADIAFLETLAGISKTANNFITTNGTTFAPVNGSAARTAIGLGTTDSPEFAGGSLTNAVNDATGTTLTLRKNRAGAIVQWADVIGTIKFQGWNGSAYKDAGYITSFVDGTPGTGDDMPGQMEFWVTPNGTSTPVKSFYLNNDGTQYFSYGTTFGAGAACNGALTAYSATIGSSYSNALIIRKTTKSAWDHVNLQFSMDDSTDSYNYYGTIATEIHDPTNGSEDAAMSFSSYVNGSPYEFLAYYPGTALASAAIYSRTTGDAANVSVNSSGYLGRSTSSIKYKTEVRDIADAEIEKVLQLRPIDYRSVIDEQSEAKSKELRLAAAQARINELTATPVDDRKANYQDELTKAQAQWTAEKKWADKPVRSRRHSGLIAEEVAQVLPQLVTLDENDQPEAVQYERVTVYLLGMVKKQQTQIDDLLKRIEKLEKK